MLVAGVILLAVVLLVIFKVRSGKSSGNSAGGNTGETTASVTVSGPENPETESASAEPAAAVPAQKVSASFIPAYADPVPANADEALGYAAFYAQQYNYDKAIEVLQSVSGYNENSALKSAVDNYTKEKAACVAVDVNTIPHVFFHSLLNDDRGLKESVVRYDRPWRNDAAMTTARSRVHMTESGPSATFLRCVST